MRSTSLIALLALASIGTTNVASADVYEMRTYTTNEGKLDALHARFRDHTMKLFEKHGIENVGYWTPVDEERSKDTLIYIIKHKDRDAAKRSWANFMQDPDWQSAYQASIETGRLVSKVESVYMDQTDYSPLPKPDQKEPGVFELRIYTTNEGKLAGLNARFRDHTTRLFERHGISNVGYWTPADEPESLNKLIYVIKHKSQEAAKESWSAFGSDEEWKKVRAESQKDGAFLVRGGVSSTYMKPTDYSPMK